MFTGIIQSRSRVLDVATIDESLKLTIRRPESFEIQEGSSLAINGVCLTVTDLTSESLMLTVMPETYRKTTLKFLRVNDVVNIEPALTLREPLDGHFVLGHVDQTVKLVKKTQDGNSVKLTFELPDSLATFVAYKGSVALDGTSLTVTQVTDKTFTVNLIPYTADNTGLLNVHQDDQYNLEVDVLARYIQRAQVEADVW
ncbi:riboflavin synthase [Lentilactobacillus sp. SPB1-3]|uniref:Riboflavin synthase n=1 Tax=Lentilactobacillus terminaliae TaxID=3003483 RepID=A0ACD5DFG9_9LACO|nr:riboflavin synthase [Lentilactobacillus sp. SPB1-3]MCZ0976404.1 riboflavin synthase [Lentilactobacillus sp. SPB1-3]